MSFFDLFNLDPQKVVEFLAKLNIIVSTSLVDTVITIFILIAFSVFVFGGAVRLWKKGNDIRTLFSAKRKWQRNYIKKGLEHSFGDYLSIERQRCYVPTQCQGTPPHNFDEPDEAVASTPRQELISLFVDTVFTPSNTNRMLYCILAGSGMGKTTFTVQLFVEYVNKYKKSTLPYDIFIRDMGESKILEEIQTLSNELGEKAHRSILLLDALDENLQASENFEDFKSKLEDAIAPFKYVVITCRSQFFPNEQEIPVDSKIRINTTNKNLLTYNKIYICPFSSEDIDLYIRMRYKGFGKRQLRKQAKHIIGKCEHLMARPVLLSYIDDLMDENREYTTEADIYETLIQKWLRREVNSIPDSAERMKRYEELVSFSQTLATTMYQNWRETGDFRLDAIQMDDFCKKYHFDKSQYQFPRRSLINHDANGAYKFAHKSFLEYFLAKHYFENADFDFSFEGMDMAELFFQGFCKKEYREKIVDNSFKIAAIQNKYLPYDEYTLVIEKKTDFDFSHLFYVIDFENFSELELNWNAYGDNVQTFIEESGIRTITVSRYRKGGGSIRQILKGGDLEFVSIEGDELPKNFVKEAERKGIHVILNGQTIVRGVNPSFNSTLKMQLQLQVDKQLKYFQREHLEIGHTYLEDMLRQEVLEEGGKS